MMRGKRFAQIGLATLYLAAMGLGATGCSRAPAWPMLRWWSQDWYGYYYDNVMANGSPYVSRPFASAKICLSAMRAYRRNESRWAGFACARGCTQQADGVLTDCTEVVE
jgi:hypothetical protein